MSLTGLSACPNHAICVVLLGLQPLPCTRRPPHRSLQAPTTATWRAPLLPEPVDLQAIPLMEPDGIEPSTSCLQIEDENIWKDVDLEDIYL